MFNRMLSCVSSQVLPVINLIIPITLGIVNQDHFEAPLSEGIDEILCSAEIADDTISVRSRVQCAMECVQNPLCLEFNFNIDTKSCEFYNCRASHVLQATADCANYQSQKLRSGTYGSECVNQLILPEECSFPFTIYGIRYYDCTPNSLSRTHEYGCYDESHEWKSCGLPIDYAVSEVSTNITIPTFAGVTTVISIDNWVTFHRRVYETLQYDKSWLDYKTGFGDWNGDYWLGLEKVYQMTTQGTWRLRLEMQQLNTGHWGSIEYDNFKLGSEALFYTLHVSTASSFGDVPNLLWVHNGIAFTTYDADHDNWVEGVCGSYTNNNGFWFNNCFDVCLTCSMGIGGDYCYTTTSEKISLLRSSMMMKRM